jgi:hypothetical protein
MSHDDFERARHRVRLSLAAIEKEITNPGASAPICSFCLQAGSETRRLIASPTDAFICEECVSLCQQVLDDEQPGVS